ncbi:MAG: hypothetical protein ACRDIY_00330 [Chloroflexota bacterium]
MSVARAANAETLAPGAYLIVVRFDAPPRADDVAAVERSVARLGLRTTDPPGVHGRLVLVAAHLARSLPADVLGAVLSDECAGRPVGVAVYDGHALLTRLVTLGLAWALLRFAP